MKRSLGDNELTRRIVTRHVIGVDVIGAFVVVDGLQLESRMVVGEDVGEAVFRTITW